jgi:putative ABC transport system ATP-binding protein
MENVVNQNTDQPEDEEDIIDERRILTKEVIRCLKVVKDYDLDEYIVRAVDEVTLDIIRGEFVAIQGPSGAGKTTILSLIAGLDAPTSGEIFIEWVRVSDLGEETFATFRVLNIGFIFQNYNLISSFTAIENVEFPMKLANMELAMVKKRSKDLLEKVGLKEREDHLPYQLSAGEQQRVGIARALANDPPIILADEPTANLDKKSSDIIAELFKEMSNDGKTVVVVTHDDRLIKHAHRVITFEDGKITKDERLREPNTFEVIKTQITLPKDFEERYDQDINQKDAKK